MQHSAPPGPAQAACSACKRHSCVKQILKPKARNRHISMGGVFALSECQMECESSPVKGSRTVEKNTKVVLPISFIKADAKAHVSKADSRIPLQSAIIRIFLFTVKYQM